MGGAPLSRYSGEREVVFGTTASGRSAELIGIQSMVGLFITTLPFRMRIQPDKRVSEWLQEIQENQAEMQQYGYTPLVEIQRCTQAPREAPLFESLVVFESYSRDAFEEEYGGSLLNSEDLQILPKIEAGRNHFPLNLLILPARELSLRLRFDRQRYSSVGAETILTCYRRLLESVVENPEQRVCEVEMLGTEERQQLLVGWNNTEIEHIQECCLHELFEAQVGRQPETVAVVFEDIALSYGELNRQANRLGHHLRTLNVAPETRVGICVERGLAMVVALLGTLKAGGVYVPLDMEYPIEPLQYILADADVKVLIAGKQKLLEITSCICADASWEGLQGVPDANPEVEVGEENLAYVIYTSGSTGRPKGVGVEHRQIVNYVQAVSMGMGIGKESGALVSTVAADLGYTMLFPVLCGGGTLHVLSRERSLDGRQVGEYLGEHGIEDMKITPSHLAGLLVAGRGGEVIPAKRLVLGGEASRREWIEQIRKLSPGCEIWNHYGPTECTVGAVACLLSEGRVERGVPLGVPLANVRVYVVDGDGELAPAGVGGELLIGGAGVARGYLGRAGQTGERFIPDPYEGAGGRLYRTGDKVRWRRDGMLEFLGRIDEQVKIRGYRVELGEIEAQLVEHPQVSRAVVIVREDTLWDKRLVAYYTVAEGRQDAGGEQLRLYLISRLPEYMVPGAYVCLEALPLTANGKIDRKALPAPERVAGSGEGYEEPKTAVEEILAGIWGEVLRVERVGRQDNFFALGGHSLLATQIISRVRGAFSVEAPLGWLFEAPVLQQFAIRLEELRKSGVGQELPPLVRRERGGRLPLSFAQQRLWFLDQLEPGSNAYNSPKLLRMAGDLDIWALAKSFTEIVRRHEVLRTVFVAENGEAEQRVEAAGAVAVPVVDLKDLIVHERETAARRLVQQEAERAFDLSRGPLLQVQLLRVGEQEYVLSANLHHIVTDGWSNDVLVRELMALYEAYGADRPSPLAELRIQYADFAAWQREWLQGEVLERELAYWRMQLAGLEPLSLPTDFSRLAVGSHPEDSVVFVLTERLSEQLARMSRQNGVTLFMVLLAGWKVLLSRYSGQEDFAVGAAIANRNRLETEGLIGFFVNTLALRSQVKGEQNFQKYLQEIRRVVLEAYEHQDIPFERIVEEVATERDLTRNPLFQVVLTLQNTPRKELQIEDLQLGEYGAKGGQARFELSLVLGQQLDGVLAQYWNTWQTFLNEQRWSG